MCPRPPADLGFRFTQRRNGDLHVTHEGKQAGTLRGQRADEVAARLSELGFADQQHLLARVTGNFRRGNEELARNHPRNRR